MIAAFTGVAGFLLGPLLHGWAVQAGFDKDLKAGLTCPRCGEEGQWAAIRCSCGRIRWREFAMAVTVGLAFAGFTSTVGLRPVLVGHLAMAVVTAMLIATDFDHFRIPNSLLYPGSLVSFILLVVGVAFENTWGSLVRGLIAGGIYFAMLFLVFLAAKGEGFGFGDVKLAALLGLFTGYHSYRTLAWSLIITAVLGGIPALVLLAMGKGRKAAIPYGPPLIVGAWTAIVFGPQLIG